MQVFLQHLTIACSFKLWIWFISILLGIPHISTLPKLEVQNKIMSSSISVCNLVSSYGNCWGQEHSTLRQKPHLALISLTLTKHKVRLEPDLDATWKAKLQSYVLKSRGLNSWETPFRMYRARTRISKFPSSSQMLQQRCFSLVFLFYFTLCKISTTHCPLWKITGQTLLPLLRYLLLH